MTASRHARTAGAVVAILLSGGADRSSAAAPPDGVATAPFALPPSPPVAPTSTPPMASAIAWTEGTLVLQTGFGGATALTKLSGGNERLVGRDDAVATSDFGTDLATFGGGTAQALIDYTGGTDRQRQGMIATDPTDPGNRTLRFVLRAPYAASEGETKGRVQMDLYGLRPGLREFRQSVRAYLGPDFRRLESYPARITWLTLAEYWNNEWWVAGERHGFRITVGIGKASAAVGPLNLFVEAQDQGQIEVWRRNDATATIPIGQWFTLDTYYREGDRDTGRFVLAITPDGGTRRVLYDVTGFTRNTHDPAPDGVTGFNPVKLYTSAGVVDHVRANGGALQIDWDDLKLWKVR